MKSLIGGGGTKPCISNPRASIPDLRPLPTMSQMLTVLIIAFFLLGTHCSVHGNAPDDHHPGTPVSPGVGKSILEEIWAATSSTHHTTTTPKKSATTTTTDGMASKEEEDILDEEFTPNAKANRSWSSMLTIDPSKVLSTLIKRGGLFIPSSIESDVQVLRQLIRCEKAELNLVQQRMVLHNFSIQQPSSFKRKMKKEVPQPALRIGRLAIHWDSYWRPSIDIEIDDFEILVEFTNLLLTQSNWNELRKMGFPPAFAGESNNTSTTVTSNEASSSDFLRINCIDLSGDAKIQILNRPLDKTMGVFTVDMDLTDKVTDEIRKQSAENKRTTGKSGCTSTQVTQILQSYFSKRIRQVLKQAISDISKDPSSVRRSLDNFGKELDNVLDKASTSIVDYVDEAGRKIGQQLGEKLSFKMKGWGFHISSDTLEASRRRSSHTVHKQDPPQGRD